MPFRTPLSHCGTSRAPCLLQTPLPSAREGKRLCGRPRQELLQRFYGILVHLSYSTSTTERHRAFSSVSEGGRERVLRADRVGSEEHPQLSDQASTAVNIELRGEPQHFLPDVEEDRGAPWMLGK